MFCVEYILARCLHCRSYYFTGEHTAHDCVIIVNVSLRSLCSISIAACSSCVLYSTTHSVCTSAHPPCSYVQIYGNMTLARAESLLDVVFNNVEIAVKDNHLTESCAESFSLLYCHQVYKQCQNSSTSDYRTSRYFCDSDCLEVMSVCQSDWTFLTDLVESLGTPDLPSLLTGCITDGSTTEEDCTPLKAGM